MLSLGLVVGEPSGESLALGLLEELNKRHIPYTVAGVLSEKLVALGGKQLFPLERLMVMGLVEPLVRLPELWQMRRTLVQYFTQNKIDIFIGIDAPDFNLGLERALRAAGIWVVHYVSPSIWAWRRGRIKLIKRAVNLMLTLFPFELPYYTQQAIPAVCVGHSIADRVPELVEQEPARAKFNISSAQEVVLVMPGSRKQELKYLLPVYLAALAECYAQNKNLLFLLPLAHKRDEDLVQAALQGCPQLPIKIAVGGASDMMAACDIGLVTSGTATLEMMCYRKPMLIAYKTSWFTYWVVRSLIKVSYIGLPNLLANRAIVPEYIQSAVTSHNLAQGLLNLLQDKAAQKMQVQAFTDLYHSIKLNANVKAVDAILAAYNNRISFG